MFVRAAVCALLISFAGQDVAVAQSAQPVDTAQSEYNQRLTLARRYMEAIQFEKLMNGVAQASYAPVLSDADLPPEKRAHVEQVLRESFAAVMPQMMDATAAIYAEAFTLDELTEVVAFYESPVGRSLTAKSVMMTRRTDELYQAIMPSLEAEIVRRLCGASGCPAETPSQTGKAY